MTRDERELALADGFGGEVEGFLDIGVLKVGVRLQDLRVGHPVRDHVDHGRNRDAQIADAGYTCHARRVDGDAGELHLSCWDCTPARAARS